MSSQSCHVDAAACIPRGQDRASQLRRGAGLVERPRGHRAPPWAEGSHYESNPYAALDPRAGLVSSEDACADGSKSEV